MKVLWSGTVYLCIAMLFCRCITFLWICISCAWRLHLCFKFIKGYDGLFIKNWNFWNLWCLRIFFTRTFGKDSNTIHVHIFHKSSDDITEGWNYFKLAIATHKKSMLKKIIQLGETPNYWNYFTVMKGKTVSVNRW